MKVIFIKDQPGGGKKGEVKEVSSGFANNFLIPKGFALAVTVQNQSKIEKEAREAEKKKHKAEARLEALKKQLESQVFEVKVRIGDKGQIYGGVHEKEIIEVLKSKIGFGLDKNQIEISAPIKELGEHKIKVKLDGSLSAILTIKVGG